MGAESIAFSDTGRHSIIVGVGTAKGSNVAGAWASATPGATLAAVKRTHNQPRETLRLSKITWYNAARSNVSNADFVASEGQFSIRSCRLSRDQRATSWDDLKYRSALGPHGFDVWRGIWVSPSD
jgi:hypothetical protein